MGSKQKKKIQSEFENNSIDLKSFLISYCGIYNQTLMSKKISHKEIKYLLPHIKRVSFDSVMKDRECIYNGIVIIVRDSYGLIAPYLNPKENNIVDIRSITEMETREVIASKKEKKCIDNLNLYELECLCKSLKLQKKYKDYRIASEKLLQKRQKGNKKYKVKKNNLIMKGREEYDKY